MCSENLLPMLLKIKKETGLKIHLLKSQMKKVLMTDTNILKQVIT